VKQLRSHVVSLLATHVEATA